MENLNKDQIIPQNVMTRSIGVAMPGQDWVMLTGFLIHIAEDEDMVKQLFDSKEDYDYLVFVIQQIQRQAFGAMEKANTVDIIKPKNDIILV